MSVPHSFPVEHLARTVDRVVRSNPGVVTGVVIALSLVGFLPLAAALISRSVPPVVLAAAASWLLVICVALALLLGATAERARDLTEELRHTAEQITAERQQVSAERAAREAAEGRVRSMDMRLRALLGAVPSAVLVYDPGGVVVAAGGAGLSALRDEPLVGRSARELASWYPTAEAHVRRALAGEEFTVVEQLADHRVETRYLPLREDAGFAGALAVSTDLRERDRRERALRESDERFLRMFENAPIGVALVSLEGAVLMANAAFGEVLGFAPDEVAGLRFTDLTHPEDRDLDLELHGRVLRGEIPSYAIAKRLVRKDGGDLPLELTVTVVRDRGGRPLYGVRMLRVFSGEERDRHLAEHYSRYDPHTELANRFLLEDRLDEAVDLARREKQRLALVMLDVENFALIVDRLGRASVDRVLRELAQRLRSTLASGDTLARVGLHELALVLPRRGAAGAAEFVERLVAAVADGLEVDGQSVFADLRLGFAMFPEDAQDVEQLLRRADAALSVAKRSGRRCVRYTEGVPV